VKCTVTGAHKNLDDDGVKVSIAAFADQLPDPKEAILSWDDGSAKPSATKFSIFDLSWCVTGNLTFSDVPLSKGLTFKYGEGFSGVNFFLGEGPAPDMPESPAEEAPKKTDEEPPTKTDEVFKEPPRSDGEPVRKALLVGINYEGQNCALEGCINDVKNQVKTLTEKFGFDKANIRMLTEDQGTDDVKPTQAKIMEGLKWLVADTKKGDTIFFQYSGHGTQNPSDDEPDGQDEAIVPVDVFEAEWPKNLIFDDEIHEVLCKDLPDGVKCICIFDCCHSATMADLAVTRDFVIPGQEEPPKPKAKFLSPPDDVKAKMKDFKPPTGAHTKGLCLNNAEEQHMWVFSGCQDEQTSADAFINGAHQGALSWAMTKALEEANYDISFEDLLNATRANLKGQYEQIPALSTTDQSYLKCKYMTCE